jgi:hypothetical protein
VVQYNTILLGPLVLYFCVMAMSERKLASDTKIVMATGRPTPDAKVLAAHLAPKGVEATCLGLHAGTFNMANILS